MFFRKNVETREIGEAENEERQDLVTTVLDVVFEGDTAAVTIPSLVPAPTTSSHPEATPSSSLAPTPSSCLAPIPSSCLAPTPSSFMAPTPSSYPAPVPAATFLTEKRPQENRGAKWSLFHMDEATFVTKKQKAELDLLEAKRAAADAKRAASEAKRVAAEAKRKAFLLEAEYKALLIAQLKSVPDNI